MEKNLEFLIECMDDLSMEQQKVCNFLLPPSSSCPLPSNELTFFVHGQGMAGSM
jgi:hypothetical protein